MKNFGSDISNVSWLIAALVIMPPLAFLITPLAVLLLPALPLFYFGLKKLTDFKRLETWQQVPGELKTTDIGRYQVLYDRGGAVDFYFPLAHFEYEYQGLTYESNQYAYDRKSVASRDLNEINELIERLEEEQQLNVYVNPQNPRQAVLNIEVSKERKEHQWVLLVAGILLAMIFIGVWNISQ